MSEDLEKKPLLDPLSGSINGEDAVSEEILSEKKNKDILHAQGFGKKTIGFFPGVALLVNNITGPGLVTTCLLFQGSTGAGWIIPSITFIVILILSTLSGSMLCQSMSMIPGNHQFHYRYEFARLVKEYFSKWEFYVMLILLNTGLQCLNISNIILTAQTMDLALIFFFNYTCGLEFYPNLKGVCINAATASTDDSPFGNAVVITIGFILVVLMIIPMGYFNLDDNIWVQVAAFIIFIAIIIEWTITFFIHGMTVSNVPAFAPNISAVLGTILFNYTYVVTVPSWCNEKKPDVSINKSLWSSTTLSTAIYFILGVLGAFSYRVNPDGSLLDAINSSPESNNFTKLVVYIFPIVGFASSIPVYSIIVRYNLLENQICSKKWANFWAVLLPWIIVIPFYSGGYLNYFINWSTIIVNNLVNFIIPPIMYLRALNKYSTEYNKIPDKDKFVALPHFSPMQEKITALITIIFLTLLSLGSIVVNILNSLNITT